MKPYYEHGGITIYNCDFRDVLPSVQADVMVTDPPYGIGLESGMGGRHGDCAIDGDGDTAERDEALRVWGPRPALVLGKWTAPRPAGVRALLIWEKGEHVGMGDLALPWKPNTEEVYVLGSGFVGERTGSVLKHLAIAGCVGLRTSRWHPTEKPEALMMDLLRKCPPKWVVVDPFAGSCTTLVAAKRLGRRAIGIEKKIEHCTSGVERLSQEVLNFGATP
jgi:DNA modification methylase